MPEITIEPLKSLKSVMDSFEKTSLWGLATITAIAQAAIYSDATIDLPGIKIPRELAGVITFTVLCGLNFQLLRLFQLSSYFLNQVDAHDKQETTTQSQSESDRQRAHTLLKTHKAIFNPFAETMEWGSNFSDVFGLSLLLLLWWLGLQSGFRLLRSGNPTALRLTVGYGLLGLYVVFGLMSARVVWRLIHAIGQARTLVRLKGSLAVFSMVVGCFGIGTMFVKDLILSSPEKAKRALEAQHEQFSDSSFLKAVRNGDSKTAVLFLEAGISPNAADETGNTALMRAAENGSTETVRSLIKAGAKLDTKSWDYDDTALTIAAGAGHAEIVQLLIDAGANLELKGYKSRTPLARAAFNGQEEAVKALLHAGAKLEPRDIVNDTPLLGAVGSAGFKGNPRVVSILLSAGADLKPKGGYGTPLTNAALAGDVEMVRVLLKAGADVREGSPLFAAVSDLNTPPDQYGAVVQELIKAGANVNESRRDGTTPLMAAAQENHARAVQLLINAGADVKAKDLNGKAAINYAQDGETRTIIQKALQKK